MGDRRQVSRVLGIWGFFPAPFPNSGPERCPETTDNPSPRPHPSQSRPGRGGPPFAYLRLA